MRYCGEYYDAETGLIYLRARYYDPYIGRFISEDPHWNLDNMIYGDNQKAVKLLVIDGKMLCYDKYEHMVKNEDISNNTNLRSQFNPLKKNSNKFQMFEIIRAVDMQSVAQSSNMYSYCINNPINNVDPNGTYLISGTLLLKGAAVIAGAFMTSVLLVDLNQKVGDVLKTRKGSIKNAPKPPGTPGWDMVRDLTMAEIYRRAQKGDPGFKTLWKLLNDGRFKK